MSEGPLDSLASRRVAQTSEGDLNFSVLVQRPTSIVLQYSAKDHPTLVKLGPAEHSAPRDTPYMPVGRPQRLSRASKGSPGTPGHPKPYGA